MTKATELEKQIKEVKESAAYKQIMQIVTANKTVSARETELHKAGFSYATFPMGSGGVGQIKEMKDHYRIQVGYGVGKHNYAVAAILKK